jgi:hypothetical protein
MFTAHLIAALFLSQTPDSSLGEVGESCRARTDCRAGLRCINSQCSAPAMAAPVTKDGQACEATTDCSTDGSLRCIAHVCKPRGAVSASTTTVYSPPPPPPSPGYVPSSANFSGDGQPTRSASLIDAPPVPRRDASVSVTSQVLQLETEIDSINSQLRALQTGWPGGSIALVVIGAILSPLALFGLIATFVVPVVGIPLLIVGLGGVAMIVGGAMGGSRANEEVLAERESLIQRRDAATRELKNLQRVGAVTPQAPATMVTLAAF